MERGITNKNKVPLSLVQGKHKIAKFDLFWWFYLIFIKKRRQKINKRNKRLEELERLKIEREKEEENKYWGKIKIRNKNKSPVEHDKTKMIKLRFTDTLLEKILTEILPKADTEAINKLRK